MYTAKRISITQLNKKRKQNNNYQN